MSVVVDVVAVVVALVVVLGSDVEANVQRPTVCTVFFTAHPALEVAKTPVWPMFRASC